MQEFVQHVKVTGTQQAIQHLRELGYTVEGLGESTTEAGKKGSESATLMDQMGESARRAITSYLGFGTILKLFEQFRQMLEDVVRLQSELASGSVGLADSSKKLARQLNVSEEEGASILTKLAISGGATDARSAEQFGIAADIAFSKANLGGLRAGGNFQLAQRIFSFAGVKGFEGTEAADLVKLLGVTGNLESPEKADAAMAKLSAAALASDAQSTGAYIAQTLKGSTGLIQQNVPLETLLKINTRARSAEVNEDIAAQTVATLEQVAIGRTEKKLEPLIRQWARDKGLDYKSLSGPERVDAVLAIFEGMTTDKEFENVRRRVVPERFLRLAKAFGPQNVAATAPAQQAVDDASTIDVELAIERGEQEITFRQRQNQHAQAFDAFRVGVETFTISQARARAKKLLDAQLAEGVVQVLPGAREAEEERIVLGLLMSRIDRLRREGADVSGAERAVQDVGKFLPGFGGGYRDSRLSAIAEATDEASRNLTLNRQAKLEEKRRSVNITNYNIGTQFNAADPLLVPQEIKDWNQ